GPNSSSCGRGSTRDRRPSGCASTSRTSATALRRRNDASACFDRGWHDASACCRFSRSDDSERRGVPIAKRGTGSRTLSSIRLSPGKGAAPSWESLKPSQQKYSRRRKVSPSSDFLRLRKAAFSKILRRNEEVAEAICGPQRLITDAVR